MRYYLVVCGSCYGGDIDLDRNTRIFRFRKDAIAYKKKLNDEIVKRDGHLNTIYYVIIEVKEG